ncbi:MAG TPA: hypothetical protein VH817_07145 [Thermoleophilaceae bacterium]
MELRVSTLRRVATAMGAAEAGRCLTCGGSVRAGQPHIRLRGAVFHMACARYRRRHT